VNQLGAKDLTHLGGMDTCSELIPGHGRRQDGGRVFRKGTLFHLRQALDSVSANGGGAGRPAPRLSTSQALGWRPPIGFPVQEGASGLRGFDRGRLSLSAERECDRA
jgi:hypothetical protein